ncbi:MAG: roadblock/LC7 domain-containing protein [Chloroflexota bacterium]
MYSPRPERSQIEQRLFELQRAHPTIEGLMLVSTGGFTLATTFQKADSVSRLAAVTRTMYLLARDTCAEFDRGEMQAVHLSYRRGHAGDDNLPSTVLLRSVTEDLMLVIVLHIPAGHNLRQQMAFQSDVERIIGYLAHQIAFEGRH